MHDIQSLALEGAHSELRSLLQLRHCAQDLNIYSRQYSRSHLLGQQKTVQRGRGMEFEEVRQYQPGDDVRTIDWRVTARTQVPHTKLYREERERPVLIVCDLRAPMFFGSQKRFKTVQLANIATLLAWAGLQHKDRVGALLFDGKGHKDIRPARSKHRVMQILQGLCDINGELRSPIPASGETPLDEILMDVRRVARPGGAVFILSDFHDFDTKAESQLNRLARHIDVSCVRIHDPLEAQLPALSGLRISDGTRSSPMQLSAQERSQFTSDAEQKLEALSTACQRNAVELLNISTADDPQATMQNRFSQLAQRARKGAKS